MPRSLLFILGMLWLSGLASGVAMAQEVNPQGPKAVAVVQEQVRSIESIQRVAAQAWAIERHLPTTVHQADGRRVLLVGLDAIRPVYLTTHNRNAALTTHTSTLHPGNLLGLALTGQDMDIGIWDGGVPLATHQELTGRVTVLDPAAADDHATHVAGTLAASGVRSDARGMAYQAHLRAYDWDDDTTEMLSEAARGLLVSNHSYGIIAGWYYGDLEEEGDRWYWLGDPSISQEEDYIFGWYDVEAAQFDRVVFSNPYLLPVVAAGNDRDDQGPASGTYRALNTRGLWRTYELSDTPHPRDGGTDGYDTLAGASLAKNVLTVGAIRLTGSGEPSTSRFTSFGPTDDGRIKPDLVGYGERVWSSVASGPTAYAFFTGTSMATPNVAGSLALLQQHYANLTGRPMRAATLKGLALHTADDLGAPGPDYRHGWGLLNTEAAARHLATAPENDLAVLEATLDNETVFSRSARVTKERPVRITLSWTEPPSSRLPLRGPSSLNDATPHLRNDLDLRLINETTGETYLPYHLDPALPDRPAVPGDNDVDPIEQIYVPQAQAGDYTIVVTHKGRLEADASQVFALLVSGAQTAVRPVAVSHLNAETSIARVRLTWKTPFERAEGHFLIQRAPVTFGDGAEEIIGAFVPVGTLETNGPAEQAQHYAYDEPHVGAGRYRYQVVFEGEDSRFLAASVEALVPAPERLALLSNYPNPFQSRTQIVLDLPKPQRVILEIYDVLGRRIRVLYDGVLQAGRHELSVDASGWASGLYLARLTTPEAATSHPMIVMD